MASAQLPSNKRNGVQYNTFFTSLIITKNGKPVALLTGINDEDDLDSLLLAHNPRFLQMLEAARERVRRTGGIPSNEFWAQVRKRRARKKKG
jgi:antitoxin (DNA-binding transcriptional repressor) of toxin-antitoxin stability system